MLSKQVGDAGKPREERALRRRQPGDFLTQCMKASFDERGDDSMVLRLQEVAEAFVTADCLISKEIEAMEILHGEWFARP